jgi:hypothetical protein
MEEFDSLAKYYHLKKNLLFFLLKEMDYFLFYGRIYCHENLGKRFTIF